MPSLSRAARISTRPSAGTSTRGGRTGPPDRPTRSIPAFIIATSPYLALNLFQGDKLPLDEDHGLPVLIAGEVEEFEFVLRRKVDDAGRESVNAHLETKVEHTRVVAFVADPDKAVAEGLNGGEKIMRRPARILDPDDTVDLREPEKEPCGPGLGVIWH